MLGWCNTMHISEEHASGSGHVIWELLAMYCGCTGRMFKALPSIIFHKCYGLHTRCLSASPAAGACSIFYRIPICWWPGQHTFSVPVVRNHRVIQIFVWIGRWPLAQPHRIFHGCQLKYHHNHGPQKKNQKKNQIMALNVSSLYLPQMSLHADDM